jgi:hypothetical protein
MIMTFNFMKEGIYMKKALPFFCAAAIISSPFASNASAIEEDSVITDVIEEGQADTEDSLAEDIKVLTLDTVIQQALETDQNIVLMKYELEALKNQTLDVVYDKNDVARDVRELNRDLDKLKKKRDDLEGQERIANGQERIAIGDAVEAYEDQITLLENAVEELESGQITLQLQGEEVKEGVSLQVTSEYVGLLNLQQQIDFNQKSIQSAARDAQAAERRYEYGLVSKDAVDQAKRAEITRQKELEKQQKSYFYNLAALTLKLNVNYNPDMELTPIDLSAAETETETASVTDSDALILNTFQLKRAQESLALANYKQNEVYEDEDSSQYAKEEQDYRVKAAEETIKKLQKELTTKVETLSYNLDITKFDYEEALRNLENLEKDITSLEKRYQFGLVSRYEYETSLLQLDQLKLNVELNKMNHFIAEKNIEALTKGYIQ